jgi:hypothetical protein
MDDYVLGFDISTSNIGIAISKDSNKRNLESLLHLSLSKTDDDLQQDVINKANIFVDFLKDHHLDSLNVSNIFIEEALKGSQNPTTLAKLNRFAGILHSEIKHFFGIEPEYITFNNARRLAFPEICPNNKLYSNVPKKLSNGTLLKEYRKLLIVTRIAERYPAIEWKLRNNLTIDPSNFDNADAVTIIEGMMIKKGVWKPMNKDFRESLNFIQEYYDYLKWIKENGLTTKKFTPQAKKSMKTDYLLNKVRIKKYLNVLI